MYRTMCYDDGTVAPIWFSVVMKAFSDFINYLSGLDVDEVLISIQLH